ncbi:hypothetical protein [Enhygromyxa salina]|uniref:Uncharacterized protein n=1 Tax=Enhygromyxa salina TaxID=215803 RepID=A0A2S9YQL4_9BACT|nr:hypothetical protein [Enhygromyxa salina]PRQ07395.1 hypothetical protein ENSA7_31080 [Enhygromyxa salina]
MAWLLGCVSDDTTLGPDAHGTADDTATGTGDDTGAGACDPYEPNDNVADATPIDPDTTLDAALCSGRDDVDWWTFTLPEAAYVGVEVLFAKDQQDVSLELWQGANLLDSSADGADILAIHDRLGAGTYEILVERQDGSPKYTLKTYALPSQMVMGDGTATRVFCPRFDLDNDYEDASVQADMREDFGLDDSPDRWRPEAMLVRVLDNQGDVLKAWGPLNADGCTSQLTTPSPNDTQFELEYVLWSVFWRPNSPQTFVITYDCDELKPCVLPRRSFAWTTPAGAAVVDTQFIASGDEGQELREALLVYWATAFSESRVSMERDAHIYARSLGSADLGGGVYMACPTGYCPNGATCETRPVPGFDHCRPKSRGTANVGGRPTLDIAANDPAGDGAPETKFTIAHELGHVQTLWAAGYGSMPVDVNYGWCSSIIGSDSTHTADSPEWQSVALSEGFADFYATAVFNRLEPGAWFGAEDVENDTQRYQAQCQASLDSLIMKGKCAQPGDATLCTDPGGSNEIDWAGTLWDFAKVVGTPQLSDVLSLLVEAMHSGAWDPGSTTIDAYNTILQAAFQRFPANAGDFDAAAQANGTNR